MSQREIPTLKAFRDVCINYGMALTSENHLEALQEVHNNLPGIILEHAKTKRRSAFDQMDTYLKMLEEHYGSR